MVKWSNLGGGEGGIKKVVNVGGKKHNINIA